MSVGTVKAAEVSQASSGSEDTDEKKKFLHMNIEEHEKKAMVKAGMLGMNVVGLTIYIQETCMLKGARAFMVNRTLEEYGEIIKLNPSAQDLEDEKYDFEYSAFVITKEEPEKLVKAAANVSEVKEVVADYIHLSNDIVASYTSILMEDEQNSMQPKAVLKDAVSLKSGNAPAKQAAKPVVNRSVRVDIEKLDVLMNSGK